MSVQKSSFGPWRKDEKQVVVYFVSRWAARGPDDSKSAKGNGRRAIVNPKPLSWIKI